MASNAVGGAGYRPCGDGNQRAHLQDRKRRFRRIERIGRVEVSGAGVEHLCEGRDGKGGDGAHVHECTSGGNERGRVEVEHRDGCAGHGVECDAKADKMQTYTGQNDRPRREAQGFRGFAEGPCGCGGDRDTKRDQDKISAVWVFVEQFDRPADTEHARADQRTCMAQKAIQRVGFEQNGNASGEERSAKKRDAKSIGDPEDKAERGRDDAPGQDDINDEREHRIARAAGDFCSLRLGQKALGEELVGIDHMGHDVHSLNVVQITDSQYMNDVQDVF